MYTPGMDPGLHRMPTPTAPTGWGAYQQPGWNATSSTDMWWRTSNEQQYQQQQMQQVPGPPAGAPSMQEEAEVYCKMLLPNHIAGGLIGENGGAILVMEQQFDITMKISPKDMFFPGTRERICLVSGSYSNITNCLYHLMDHTHSQHNPEKVLTRLAVPRSSASVLIGRGGTTMRAMCERTHCLITVSPTVDDFNERLVSMSGSLKNSKKAVIEVITKIQADPHILDNQQVEYDVILPLDAWDGNRAQPMNLDRLLIRPEHAGKYEKRTLIEYLREAAPRKVLLEFKLLGDVKRVTKAKSMVELRQAVKDTWEWRWNGEEPDEDCCEPAEWEHPAQGPLPAGPLPVGPLPVGLVKKPSELDCQAPQAAGAAGAEGKQVFLKAAASLLDADGSDEATPAPADEDMVASAPARDGDVASPATDDDVIAAAEALFPIDDDDALAAAPTSEGVVAAAPASEEASPAAPTSEEASAAAPASDEAGIVTSANEAESPDMASKTERATKEQDTGDVAAGPTVAPVALDLENVHRGSGKKKAEVYSLATHRSSTQDATPTMPEKPLMQVQLEAAILELMEHAIKTMSAAFVKNELAKMKRRLGDSNRIHGDAYLHMPGEALKLQLLAESRVLDRLGMVSNALRRVVASSSVAVVFGNSRHHVFLCEVVLEMLDTLQAETHSFHVDKRLVECKVACMQAYQQLCCSEPGDVREERMREARQRAFTELVAKRNKAQQEALARFLREQGPEPASGAAASNKEQAALPAQQGEDDAQPWGQLVGWLPAALPVALVTALAVVTGHVMHPDDVAMVVPAADYFHSLGHALSSAASLQHDVLSSATTAAATTVAATTNLS